MRTTALAIAFNVAATAPLMAQQRRDDTPARYAALAIEESTGRVLYETGAHKILRPASTTKMMTAFVVFKALRNHDLTLDQMLPVSENAASQPATNLSMIEDVPVKKTVTDRHGRKHTVITGTERKQVVDRISVENALRGMLCHSANDAAVVFAEALAGSTAAFADRMNEEARKLGMTDTHFENPNGLPDERHHTTVEDMSKLAYALYEDFPEYYQYFSIRSFSFNGRTYRNTNHLLGVYPGLDGFKTGWIASSGFNLVASAHRGDDRVIGIVFGAEQAEGRNEDMTRILNNAFQKLRTARAEEKMKHPPRKAKPDRFVALPPKELETPALAAPEPPQPDPVLPLPAPRAPGAPA